MSRKVRFEDAGLVEKHTAKKRSAVLSYDEEEEYSNEERPFLDMNIARGNKRARRQGQRQQGGKAEDLDDDQADKDDDDDDDEPATEVSKQASLELDGIPIEPFHMKNENTDGTGYFDGDTYVFRRKSSAQDDAEEPDAWLDQLDEDDIELSKKNTPRMDSSHTIYDPTKTKTLSNITAVSEPAKRTTHDLSDLELYAKIQPHLGNDHESIMEAIYRYGGLLKAGSEKARHIAKEAFNELTEAASALMLRGNINIYQMKRSQIPYQSLSSSIATATSASSSTFLTSPSPNNNESSSSTVVQWQYKGSADGQIHGPYSTRDMLNWVQAGYFMGSSAVQVRTIETTGKKHSSSPSLSAVVDAVAKTTCNTRDDLLSDLMDEDDYHHHHGKIQESNETTTASDANDLGSSTLWGEWQISDQVDFAKYLSSSSS